MRKPPNRRMRLSVVGSPGVNQKRSQAAHSPRMPVASSKLLLPALAMFPLRRAFRFLDYYCRGAFGMLPPGIGLASKAGFAAFKGGFAGASAGKLVGSLE